MRATTAAKHLLKKFGLAPTPRGASRKLYHVGHRGYICSSSIAGINAQAWASAFSPEWPAKRPVGAVFSCAASRKRGRTADFTLEPGGLSVRENLLRLACGAVELWGLNDSLTSSPLRPRWPLLFGIIQKVGKKIIQGGLTSPLEIPRQPPPGPGVPLGTRTAPTGCFAGLFSDKRDARGYSWSLSITGANARYWHFNYNFLARQACKTPCGRVAGPPGTGRSRKNKKARGLPQPSCPASHAPRSGGDAPRIKTLNTLEKFLFYFNLVFRNATVLTARPMPVIGESGLPSLSKGRMVLVE